MDVIKEAIDAHIDGLRDINRKVCDFCDVDVVLLRTLLL